jgi:N-acetylneuraminic acid mutarotase
MPTARNHAAGGAAGGKIYIIGGRLAAPNIGSFLSSNTDNVEEYDPATDAWRPMTKMPTPRSGHGWTTHEGRIYVAGGEMRDSHMDAVFRDVEVFDPAVNDWYRLPAMPTARHGVNLAALGNRLHAVGGHLAFAATGGEALHTAAHDVFEFRSR